MPIAKTLILLSGVLTLAGCASSYGPSGFGGGYTETRRAPNVYVVSFRGNGYTKPEQAEEMAFLRAAELTIEQGYRYFAILNESSRSDSVAVPMAGQSFTTGTMNPYGGFQARTTTTGGVPLVMSTPTARLHIGMLREKPVGTMVFYDAADVLADLGAKHKK